VPKAALAIIGEPTEWGIVTGHKGGGAYDIHVHGHEVHSSMPHTGVSAIMEGARLIDWANRVNEENRAKGQRRQRLRSGVDDAACGHHPWRYGAQHHGQGLYVHPVGALHPGGTGAALARPDARRDPARRAGDEGGPPRDRHHLRPTLERARPDGRTEGEAEALVRRLTGENGSSVVSYGTEAGQFQAAGYSAVVCGPGNIAQAHQPNEYLTVDQLQKGEAFMARLLDTLMED
jgi:acetylornithine deacetylase